MAYVRWYRGVPCGNLRSAADRIGLDERTVQEWCRLWRENKLTIELLGRKPRPAAPADLRELYFLLEVLGPEVGVALLAALLPQLSRALIARVLYAYRRDCVDENRQVVQRLTWTNRGAVWAMDYTDPPAPIEAQYPAILCVRDLGAGVTLAAIPVPDLEAATLLPILAALFVRYGVPLVIKADNGSAFIAMETRRFLAERGVRALYSPPGMPRFNGACEAGNGAIKTRAHYIAARNGRPAHWTCNDVEAARLQSNQTVQNTNCVVGTPDDLWAKRIPVSEVDRGTLEAAIRSHREEVIREIAPLPGATTDTRLLATIERIAIARALVYLGYLDIRRSRLHQPISRRLRAIIS